MTENTFKDYMGLLLIVVIGILAYTKYYGIFDNFYIGYIAIYIALYIVMRLFTREMPKKEEEEIEKF